MASVCVGSAYSDTHPRLISSVTRVVEIGRLRRMYVNGVVSRYPTNVSNASRINKKSRYILIKKIRFTT